MSNRAITDRLQGLLTRLEAESLPGDAAIVRDALRALSSQPNAASELGFDLRALVGYADWQMSEGTNYHPTLPSAVARAKDTLAVHGLDTMPIPKVRAARVPKMNEVEKEFHATAFQVMNALYVFVHDKWRYIVLALVVLGLFIVAGLHKGKPW